ncbi:MAG: hypothetical protein QOE28_1544 [Solirubrobacteraceae bacterium]|nr:hypothetical protein [Solirubrobacteraceae bacterium]
MKMGPRPQAPRGWIGAHADIARRAALARDDAVMRWPALLIAVLLAGCGGVHHPGHAAGARTPGAAPTPASSAAPAAARSCGAGPSRVSTATASLSRRSAISGARRGVDPTVWYPALAARGCRLPLILFSHGHYGAPAGCSRLCGALAADGFVVLAPLHADRGTPLGLQAAERVDDLTFLLDHLPEVWKRLAPALSGRVEASTFGVFGHSFGGRTAAELAGQDARVRALMTMAGGADRGTTGQIRAATLMLAGSADTVDPVHLSEASLHALPVATPKGLLVVEGARHGDLIDGCVRLPGACAKIAGVAGALFETYVAGRRGASAPLRAAGFR